MKGPICIYKYIIMQKNKKQELGKNCAAKFLALWTVLKRILTIKINV